MRFEPVNVPVSGMKAWVAQSCGYSFVITYEPLPGDAKYSGYTASWKNVAADMRPFGGQPSNRLDGGPWQTFVEAEAACRSTLKRLVNKQ